MQVVKKHAGHARTIIFCLALCLSSQVAHGSFHYADVSDAVGLAGYTMAPGHGGGVSAADYDNDGDIDLFVPTAEGIPNQLYRNEGGVFTEVAADVGLALLDRSRVSLWFDYDGDGLLDLIVGGDCFELEAPCANSLTLHLYRQVDGNFVDTTAEAGITTDLIEDGEPHRGGLAAGDINNDGFLDLVLGMWHGEGRVLLNNGDATFTDISVSSGLGGAPVNYWQHMIHDFNHDGFADIYTTIDFGQNKFWINQKDNSFVDVAAETGTDNEFEGMGLTFGDYDNDGDFDIYLTNFARAERYNILYNNQTIGNTLQFQEMARERGVDRASFGWGCTFHDADNDGLLDLAVTNGFNYGLRLADQSVFFHNQGGPDHNFVDIATTVGFDDTLWGSALLAIDYNRDGRLDLVQTTQTTPERNSTLRLLHNEHDETTTQNNYLVIKPRMDGPNRFAIGAVVRATFGDQTLSRLITAGNSFMGQEPAEAHFGLGTASQVEIITIEWPDGTASALREVQANQVVTVENRPLDTDRDGVSDTNEVAFGTDPLDASSTPALPTQHPWALALSVLLLVTALHARRATPKR